MDDRRVLNGIFWVLGSGAPWRDLPECYGPYTTCYNRFVRWRRAGIWRRLMDALAVAHDAAVQMIDTTIVRVHQHAACVARNKAQSMGRSRGGMTSRIHVVVDTNGLPVRLGLTAKPMTTGSPANSSGLRSGSMLLADRRFRDPWIRAFAAEKGVWANIPPRCNRNEPICFSPYLFTEIWSNGSSIRMTLSHEVATRYDKLAANYLAFIELASIRLWLRVNEFTP